MKHKLISRVFLIAFILVACVPATQISPIKAIIPTLTSTSKPIPSSTPSINSYPPCYPVSTSSSENMPTPILESELPNGLILRQYEFNDYVPPSPTLESGCMYETRDMSFTGKEINLNNLFRVIISPININNERNQTIVIMNGENKLFETKTMAGTYSGLLAAWEYDDHWVIEVTTSFMHYPNADGIDIIRDGISLKQANNYKDVFGFQLLDNKPLYFYIKHDKTFGINFNGIETQLNYDVPPYPDLHPGSDAKIYQFQNMVLFHVGKDGFGYDATISVFDK